MRKSKKSLIFVLLFIVIAFIFFTLINIQEIMDYPKIEAAGNKVLIPVNVKQKTSKRHYKRRTTETITNYVQFVVEINNSRKSFYMKTSDAYGSNSASAGLEAVASKKKIERYIFYTDKHIYYSKNAATTGEYIRESITGKLIVFCVIIAFISLGFLLVNISDKIAEKRRIKSKTNV
ncbi:MAG: hypothetical protein HFH68_07650 [Lachnospiraceae bacterium]|nr:hypothetical protein [Lachnospiraceae bacterium]